MGHSSIINEHFNSEKKKITIQKSKSRQGCFLKHLKGRGEKRKKKKKTIIRNKQINKKKEVIYRIWFDLSK